MPIASASVLLTSCPDGLGHPPASHCYSVGNATIECTVIAASKTDPTVVQFIDKSKGKEDSIVWNFGDGTSLSSKKGEKITTALKNPIHKFKKLGYYIPCCTIQCNGNVKKMWEHYQLWVKK